MTSASGNMAVVDVGATTYLNVASKRCSSASMRARWHSARTTNSPRAVVVRHNSTSMVQNAR